MKKVIFLFAALCSAVLAAPPVVSNIRASQRPGTKLVDVYYDLSDADGDLQLIQIAASSDAGLTYGLPCVTLSGHIGANISPGSNRHIVWNAGADWSGNWVPECRMRVTAHDGTTPPAPPGMAYIPGGPFQMGDNLDGMTDAMPVRNVQVDAFFIDKTEVPKALWQNVQTWGNANGYSIGVGGFKADNHPVHSVNWYDAVKWCNARSEKEGLTPCYYTNAAQTAIYKIGNINIENGWVKWNANGYRLPTEAEWEKAARGGATGLRYPWGNSITVSNANYSVGGNPWVTGSTPYTNPVGSYPANDYGLFDMAGNLLEWTWDWYGGGYYGTPGSIDNPNGPVSGGNRVLRGGTWGYGSGDCRAAVRSISISFSPDTSYNRFGFRTVRR
jgi:formylglycine-generating enzyme